MGNRKTLIYAVLFLVFASLVFILIEKPGLEKKKVEFVYGINESNKISEVINISYPPTKIIRNCSADSDCVWMSVNCCGEENGAKWECLNKKSYIDCKSKLVLCPKIASPVPKEKCRCVRGVCSVV